MMTYDMQKDLMGKIKVQAYNDVGLCIELGASQNELSNMYDMISSSMKDAESLLYAINELKKHQGADK